MEGCCESNSWSAGAVEGTKLLDQWSMLLLLTAVYCLEVYFVSNDFVSSNELNV